MLDTEFFEDLSASLPEFFTRKEICSHLGGVIAPRTLANLDSKGLGCPNRKMLCGKVVYPKVDFFNWLEGRMSRN